MDLRQLATFQMVAALKSFTGAARALDYAQSTITNHIQALEQDLGVPLFDRNGKSVELTDAGERFLAYSQRLLDLAEESRASVSGYDDLAGALTIGAPETVCAYRLPAVLRQFRMEAPNTRLIFRPMAYERLFKGAKDGVIDVVFMLERSLRAPSLKIEQLTEEPLVIVAHAGHPLADAGSVSLADLKDEQLLLTERGCGYRGIFERALADAGVRQGTNMEFDSVDAIKQCVIGEVGIAILPRVAVEREIQEKRLTALPVVDARFSVYTQILWRRDKWISPTMALFLNICRDVLKPNQSSRVVNSFNNRGA